MNSSLFFRRLCLAALSASFMGITTGLFAQKINETETEQRDRLVRENLTDEQFARKAAMVGLQEIHCGQLALKRAEDPAVKAFANILIQDHQSNQVQLMQIAKNKHFSLPPTNLFAYIDDNTLGTRRYVREKELPETPQAQPDAQPTQRANSVQGDVADTIRQWNVKPDTIQMARQLQRLSGAEFDRAFIASMVDDHTKAVQLFESGITSLTDPELKSFVQRTLPVLKEHLQMAGGLASDREQNKPKE